MLIWIFLIQFISFCYKNSSAYKILYILVPLVSGRINKMKKITINVSQIITMVNFLVLQLAVKIFLNYWGFIFLVLSTLSNSTSLYTHIYTCITINLKLHRNYATKIRQNKNSWCTQSCIIEWPFDHCLTFRDPVTDLLILCIYYPWTYM